MNTANLFLKILPIGALICLYDKPQVKGRIIHLEQIEEEAVGSYP